MTISYGTYRIGSQAFYGCTALTQATISPRVSEIGYLAFGNCEKLRIYCYESTEAHKYAKDNKIPYEILGSPCGNNTYWHLQNGWLTISGDGYMDDYDSDNRPPWYSKRDTITTLVIEEGVSSVGKNAFCDCSKLLDVKIPKSVDFIDDGAFTDCARLRNVEMPNGLYHINKSVFFGCANLASVTIPESVLSIGDEAFAYCDNLASVIVLNSSCAISDGGNDVFEGVSFSLVLYGWPGSKAQTYAKTEGVTFQPLSSPTFFLPAGLESIDESTFQGIKAEGVFIPKSVKTISGNPFSGSSVKYIYGYPFGAAQTFAETYDFVFVAIDDSWLASHR